MNPENEELFSRLCDGLATAAEIADFHRRLRTEPETLDAWLRYADLHTELAAGSLLGETSAAASAFAASPAPRPQPRAWLQWLPQAAAGLCLGLFAASMVWAYVIPAPVVPHTLLAEDFESAAAAPASRVPLEVGLWRGDSAEIVGPESAVLPAKGTKMLRFLRADAEVPAKPSGGHIAVVYRLIDLRPFRAEFADGAGVLEVSARFNAMEFPADERYGCAISLYALEADSIPERVGRLGSALADEALAMARSSRTKLDRDPASWQRLTTELRLPPNAEFVAVRLHINQTFESGDNPVFKGSYADDIRVSLTRRAPLP